MKEEKVVSVGGLAAGYLPDHNDKYWDSYVTAEMVKEAVENITGIKGASSGSRSTSKRRGPTRPDVQQLQF